ncbi:MAG: EamA family transporter [bacterium]
MKGGFDRTDAQLALLVVIWGTAFPIIPVVEQALGPFQLTWYRYLPFPILYGAYLLTRRRAMFATVTGRDWLVMGAIGCVGVIGYHFPLNWALDPARPGALTGAAGAIIIATTPLWTMLIAVVTGHERYNGLAALGTAIAFGGVGVVIALGQADSNVHLAAGALVALLAPISWALYSVYTKPMIARYGGIFVTGVTLSIGTFALLPIGIQYGVAPLRALSAVQWWGLAFLAILSTALGYALWNDALKRRTASAVSAYIYFNPVVATVVAVLFFHERLTAYFALGGALVIAGVLLVNRARLAAAAVAAVPVKS